MEKQLLSVVLPVYNESLNIPLLFERLTSVLSKLPYDYEIIAVDDCSRDDSYAKLSALAKTDYHVRAIKFKRNFGQTAALAAGIQAARGQVIATIDSDLENDPNDIPRLLAKLDEGYDVVSGWRKSRWEGALVTRKLPSIAANWLISRVSRVPLHDYGCTLKVYRADLIKDVNLYGDMHRFIAAYVAWEGGRVAEIVVSHHPRIHGKSNYGFGRTFRVVLDLIVMKFMHKYFNRPMHFFGGWGFAALALGIFAGVVALLLRVVWGLHLIQTPLPILATLLAVVGAQLMLFGVLAEILMRTYYESQNKRPYIIKEQSDAIV